MKKSNADVMSEAGKHYSLLHVYAFVNFTAVIAQPPQMQVVRVQVLELTKLFRAVFRGQWTRFRRL